MKHLLFCLLFLSVKTSFAQNTTATITSYTDERLPSELVSAISQITTDNFEKFKQRGTETKTYNGLETRLKYKVKYENGQIVGIIDLTSTGNKQTFDVDLTFRFCCSNHDPVHCAQKKEELEKLQKDNKCEAWVRAKVEK